MNYVESFNLFGVEAKEIPCIKGSGKPTAYTRGAVGCFYMDTTSGKIYRCVNTSNGVYTWEIDTYIDDSNVGSGTWSSQKIAEEISNAISKTIISATVE